MNYSFGVKSRDRLSTCHPALRAVATRAIELTPVDFMIVWGWRSQADQDRAFETGVSKVRWPNSRHNVMDGSQPYSHAFDFAPWVDNSIPWADTHLFALIAGVMFAAAAERHVALRWGGDFNRNGLTNDQRFTDWGHIELAPVPPA